jgi:uncharacterized Rossmann fold enzyme
LIVAKAAFIADSDEGCRPDVRITDWAFTVAFITEATDSNAWLLAAHNEISDDSISTLQVKEEREIVARRFGGANEVELTDDGET